MATVTEVSAPRFEEAIAASPRLRRLLWKGAFGLETERVRVDAEGRLALTQHPPALGNKSDHPFITTDFSESQLELVTPPMASLEEAHGFLKTALNVARAAMPADELLWPQSMPPILPEAEEDIPIAQFEGAFRGRTEYRARLAEIYGRARQTISGSHFNFSLAPEFFAALSEATGEPVSALQKRVYLKIVRNLMRDRWLLVGLLGRSPVAHESLRLKDLDTQGLVQLCGECGVSIRSSRIGYRNREPLATDYCCLEGYAADLDAHIRQGKLLGPKELYLPIRLKMGADGQTLSHLEFRMLDLDPLEATGVSLASLRLLHAVAVYSIFQDESGRFDSAQQALADALQNEVACCGFSGESTCCELDGRAQALRTEALERLDAMEWTLAEVASPLPEGYREALAGFRRSVEDWKQHPANVMRRQIQAEGFVAFHLERARAQEAELARDRFRFHPFADLELSTQLLLKAALLKGVRFEILDRTSNFIRLSKGAKQEYVVQATKTSLDSYSQVLAMENKKVTKFILRERGVATPSGSDYARPEEAKADWEAWRGAPAVVKPVNTNFGIGITILKTNLDRTAFEQAVDLAFSKDEQILVESYVEGREFRYFLIDGEVVAILHRVPANVVGDGRRSILELVELKNQDPLRGEGYRTPLERIRLGATEGAFLRERGLGFDSRPRAGERVFLRENSNISTGGDSIDYTDRAHPSYAAIASSAARALQASIVGLDLIARDIEAPATPENHAVIEANFNPAIHIHCYPFEGKDRQLGERVLAALGF